MWPAVQDQRVLQALDYSARGEVKAGIVYASDTALMTDKVKVALGMPTETRALYLIAAVAGSLGRGVPL